MQGIIYFNNFHKIVLFFFRKSSPVIHYPNWELRHTIYLGRIFENMDMDPTFALPNSLFWTKGGREVGSHENPNLVGARNGIDQYRKSSQVKALDFALPSVRSSSYFLSFVGRFCCIRSLISNQKLKSLEGSHGRASQFLLLFWRLIGWSEEVARGLRLWFPGNLLIHQWFVPFPGFFLLLQDLLF